MFIPILPLLGEEEMKAADDAATPDTDTDMTKEKLLSRKQRIQERYLHRPRRQHI